MPSPRTRILYFTSYFVSQGGASLSFLKLFEAFNRGIFEAFAIVPEEARPQIARQLLSPELAGRLHYLKIDRISRQLLHPWRLLRFLGRAIGGVLAIRRRLRQWQIEVVHANDLRDFHAPLAAWSCGVPVVWHLRASRPNPLTRYPVAAMIHGLATKIVAVSQCTARQMALKRSFAQNKVVVIYNPGPYRETFHPRVDGAPLRRAFGFPADAPVITMIAKLSQRKGHAVFVQALPLILAKIPNARFMIVGGELEGHEDYARSLRAQARPFVRNGMLLFTGERSDVPQIMAASDVIVQSSLCQDAFPGIVLEGMAVGRVVVACNAGGIPEQITDGEDGLLFNRGDANDLARQVIRVLSDSARKRALEQAAVRNLERKFNFGKFVREFAALYQSLCAPAN
jgi:glycosyltransferase involved in cell wall biosynthesis